MDCCNYWKEHSKKNKYIKLYDLTYAAYTNLINSYKSVTYYVESKEEKLDLEERLKNFERHHKEYAHDMKYQSKLEEDKKIFMMFYERFFTRFLNDKLP